MRFAKRTRRAPFRRHAAGSRCRRCADRLLTAGDALAQRPPYRERPEATAAMTTAAAAGARARAGVFDYYLLALSWSPTYCADIGEQRATIRNAAARGTGPMPSCCTGCGRSTSAAGRRTAAAPTAATCPGRWPSRMLDIMPSKRLVFHEYRKHGTCSGLGVDGYFDLARRLYDKVKIPPRFVGLTDDAHDGQPRRADAATSWPPTPGSSPT